MKTTIEAAINAVKYDAGFCDTALDGFADLVISNCKVCEVLECGVPLSKYVIEGE